jgi:HlyD family secretion protein
MSIRLKKSHAVVAVLLLVACALLGYHYFEHTRPFPEGLIQANGRIEGDTITVASKVAGRVTAVHVREGDLAKAGQVLIQLDDKTARAKYSQAKAAREAAAARVEAAQAALVVLRKEVPCKIAEAEAGVGAARAAMQKTTCTEQQARKESERFKTLARGGAVSSQAAERNELSWKQARDELNEARADIERAEQALEDARIGPDRIRSKEAELGALEAAEQEASARLDEAQSFLDDLLITCPADGRITARFANLGEVINAGTPLYELVDLDRLFLEVFVPEVEIGKVRLDLSARILTDAYPEKPFPARVRYIASRAEFTPKEVQTQKERVKLVYAVKLYLDENPDHCLTPGLPADAVIRWKEDEPWAKPSRR